jgi:hypothetical protein
MVDSITPDLVRKTAWDRSPSYYKLATPQAIVIDLLWYETAKNIDVRASYFISNLIIPDNYSPYFPRVKFG